MAGFGYQCPPGLAAGACGCSSGVEHNLAKVGVEGSNPFARSKMFKDFRALQCGPRKWSRSYLRWSTPGQHRMRWLLTNDAVGVPSFGYRRAEIGYSGARPQARGDHAPHAGRWKTVPSLPLWRPDREGSADFGRHRTPGFPKRSPSPGRWIRSDRKVGSGMRPRVPRLVDLSSTDTIRWRPRADPVQKHVPCDRITQERD